MMNRYLADVAAPKASSINFSNKFDDVPSLVSSIITWIFGFVAVLAVVAIVYSGLMLITSGADTAKAESAKKNLTWAIIGLILAMSAYFIVNIVVNRLNSI